MLQFLGNVSLQIACMRLVFFESHPYRVMLRMFFGLV